MEIDFAIRHLQSIFSPTSFIHSILEAVLSFLRKYFELLIST